MLIVKDYRDNKYLANIEEDLDKVDWIIYYDDRGNTFYLVSIDNHVYIYGSWENYWGFYTTNEYLRNFEPFAKKYEGYRDPFVDDCGLPLDAPLRTIYNDYMQFKDPDPVSEFWATHLVETVLKNLDKAYATGYFYDWSHYKIDALDFLKHAGIDTDENINAINNAHWSSLKKHGTIGIAAKADWTIHLCFTCDVILSIFHNGEWHDTEIDDSNIRPSFKVYRNIPYEYEDYDEYGFFSYTYSFKTINNTLSQLVLFE